ncbi:MAG: efflux RND transporter periplasmic adaptor subunit [Akkermansiaceae bacterium]|nr:efflux RND transporter periplasmic adaptor subunit [Akkermansiaceae bacterium]
MCPDCSRDGSKPQATKPLVFEENGGAAGLCFMTIKMMIGLLPALLLVACHQENPAADLPLPEYTVAVMAPKVEDVTVYGEWIGRLVPEVSVDILPRVDGHIVERFFTNGQQVKKGELLYRLDDTLYAEALQQARQNEAVAKVQAQEALQNVDYYRPLVNDGAVARQTYTEALRKEEAAQASLRAAQAAVAQAQTDVAYCELYAPVTGIAGFAEADVGSYVSPSGNPLVTVYGVQPIRVNFSISEQDWLKQGGSNGTLRPGTEVEVLTADGSLYPHKARIIGVDNAVSATLGTLQMEAQLPNPDSLLRPGMFVKVRAVTDEVKNALMVPQSAIVSQQGQQFVLALQQDNKVALIPVQTGASRGDMVQVLGEVTPDMRIVVSGTQQALMAAAGRATLKV